MAYSCFHFRRLGCCHARLRVRPYIGLGWLDVEWLYYVCTYRGIHRLGHLIYIAGLHLCGMEYGQEGAPLLSCDYTNHCHDYMSTNSPIATNNDIDKDVVHCKCLYDQ